MVFRCRQIKSLKPKAVFKAVEGISTRENEMWPEYGEAPAPKVTVSRRGHAEVTRCLPVPAAATLRLPWGVERVEGG